MQLLVYQTTNLRSVEVSAVVPSQEVREALSRAMQITLQPPRLESLQALLILMVSMLRFGNAEAQDRGSMILATAVRMAHQLRLHLLNDANGISVPDRLEKIRAFWCLYILDKENTLRTGDPPLLGDEDINVIEPRKESDDLCGMVTAQCGQQQINLFAARQRLAQISGRVYRQLYAFQAQHKPVRQRLEAATKLSEELAHWRREWFISGLETDLSSLWVWPAEVHVSIGNLHCVYVLCCSKVDSCVS